MQLTEHTYFGEGNRYYLEKLLGRGGFSEVWLVKDSITELELALKVYAPGTGMDEDGLKTFSKELANVYNLNHQNLLKPQHVDSWQGMPYLVMSYCPQGSLVKRIGKLSESEIRKVIHDVASGLAYLHERDVIHQDIKPDNILIDEMGNYVITDFGISTRARSTLRKSVAAASANSGGTIAYMGPERFGKEPAPIKASDIWSLGAMLYELMMGDTPFGEHGGLIQKSGAEIPTIKGDYSDELKQLVEKMLSPEPWDRPTAEQLAKGESVASASHRERPTVAKVNVSTPKPMVVPSSNEGTAKEGQTMSEGQANTEKNSNWHLWVWAILAVILGVGVGGLLFYNGLVRVKQEKVAASMQAQQTQSTSTASSVRKSDQNLNFTVNGVSFSMIKVDGGTFTMGATSEQGSDADSDETPTHSVTLSTYYMGETEVTQALWQAVMGSNPSESSKGDNYPVENVSYDDCKTFVSKLNSLLSSLLGGKRFALPTEAQWEYAARGGNKSQGYKYSGSNSLSAVAWYTDNSQATHPVKTKQANELGLYDMSGNVWEWCQDWYGSYSNSSLTNPQGPTSGSHRVARGGSWDDNAGYCRVSFRGYGTPSGRDNGLGLRLCLLP